MRRTLTIGMIGDQLPEYAQSQRPATEMIRRASKELGVEVETRWFPTPSLEKDVESQLTQVDALWCSPGSPYLSLDGALNGVRFARERGWPIIGTCAGFQHIVLEYARNVIGIKDAAHQEYDAEAETLVLTSLVCPIATQTLRINLLSGSHAHNVYGHGEIEEYYYCNFGINPEFQGDIDKSGLKIVGTDQNGEPRVLELPDHRFFIATLFVPGASYVENEIKIAGSHPLVNALVLAGLSFHSERGSKQSVRSAV